MKIPSLTTGTVQVWWLDLESASVVRAHAMLSADERERAGRMRMGLPREEFIAARGVLRLLLGAAVGRAPELLRFEVCEHGKPSLLGNDGVDFNVAHARGVVLLALSRDGAVGVDLEPVDRAVDALELARAHFDPREVAAIEGESEERRLELFFRCWTRKEAVVKADGRGLLVGLADFCVLDATDAQRTDQCGLEVHVPRGGAWWLRELDLAVGYAAAVAVPKRECQVQLLPFEHFQSL